MQQDKEIVTAYDGRSGTELLGRRYTAAGIDVTVIRIYAKPNGTLTGDVRVRTGLDTEFIVSADELQPPGPLPERVQRAALEFAATLEDPIGALKKRLEDSR